MTPWDRTTKYAERWGCPIRYERTSYGINRAASRYDAWVDARGVWWADEERDALASAFLVHEINHWILEIRTGEPPSWHQEELSMLALDYWAIHSLRLPWKAWAATWNFDDKGRNWNEATPKEQRDALKVARRSARSLGLMNARNQPTYNPHPK